MKKKILIVDDNRLICNFLSGLLEKEGHKVFTASDGYIALKIIMVEKPDVVFVDLFMPKIDGKRLCQMIRQMPHMDDSYIVIISATLAEMEFDYSKVGADACIAKGPFEQLGRYVLTAVADSDALTRETKPVMGLGSDGGEAVHPRQITMELLSRNRHLESMLDGIGETVLELSANTVLYANKSAEAIFNTPRETIIARNFIDLFEPVNRWRIKALLNVRDRNKAEIPPDNPIAINDKLVAMKVFILKEEVASTIVVLSDVTRPQSRMCHRAHAEKMQAVLLLADNIARTLKKHTRKMETAIESDSLTPTQKESLGMPIRQLKAYARSVDTFRQRLMQEVSEFEKGSMGEYDGLIETGKETILICGADPLSLLFSRLVLGELGYSVEIARTGESAVAKYRSRCRSSCLNIDLVAVDSKLHDLSIAALLERLKGIDSEVKVLIMGDLENDTSDLSGNPGGDLNCIHNIFNIGLLSKTLRQVLTQ